MNLRSKFLEYGWVIAVVLVVISAASALIQKRIGQWAVDSMFAAVAVAVFCVWYYWNDLDA